MECNNYVKNGFSCSKVPARSSGFGHKLGAGGASTLRLVGAACLPGGPSVDFLVSTPSPHDSNHPFMNSMDEITYWIYTKRAPCLMDYDSVTVKQNEEAHSSKTKPKSVPSKAEVPSPKKKTKRKLSLLDDDSGSAEEQQKVFFDSSQNKKQNVLSSHKSDSLVSGIDINIRKCGMHRNRKQSKLQNPSRTALHKKNKLLTSTPKKVAHLRRSLRQAQQTLNNSQVNSSFEVINTSFGNGLIQNYSVIENSAQAITNKCTELLAGGDKSNDNNKNTAIQKFYKSKNLPLNGQFEDLSDVSGLTANYIRSTKLQSTKTPRKLKCKNNRNLVRESKQNVQRECTMLVCADKSVNTAAHNTAHNCSTESENIINLVTSKSAERTAKVNKTTSLLKFIGSTPGKEAVCKQNMQTTRMKARTNLNVSFESQSNTPRYPKRHKNNSSNLDIDLSDVINLPDKKRYIIRNSNDFNHSDKKENPVRTMGSKTRSGRNIGLSLCQPENLVLVLSNSTEQVSSLVSVNVASSMVSLNVASPKVEVREQKKKHITRHLRSKTVNNSGSLQKQSLRDKSGFTACFSDSEDDSIPLKQQKFFLCLIQRTVIVYYKG